jgi:hypothetical protein
MLDHKQGRFLIGSGATLIAACSLALVIGCGSRATPKKIACASGPAKPITVERVKAALHRHGYEVTLRPARCDVEDVVMELNAVPRTDAKTLVICDIRLRPIYGNGFHRLKVGDWVQDNVQCGVYPGANPTADVAQLRAAVRSMAIR